MTDRSEPNDTTIRDRVAEFTTNGLSSLFGPRITTRKVQKAGVKAGAYGAITSLAAMALTSTVAAQADGDPCSSGIGALVATLQEWALAIALGMIVLFALIGIVLRMATPFPGASAAGGVMLMASITGPILFLVVLTMLDVILGASGISTASACSPFIG